jgi:hypothetical protein
MSKFFSLLSDGGPVFMYPTFLILLVIIVLIVKGILNRNGDNTKTMSLIGSFGLFTVAWGFAGQIIGLISAFDAIQAVGDISPSIMAGGLKISLLAPLFGLITFLFARVGIIILTWMQKE